MECAKKIVVTLTLENDKLYATDELDFEVACVNSPTGACPCPCFYAEDPTCACRDLRRSIKVSVTKTPVDAVYPLSQPRMFNGRPHEDLITTGPGGSGGRSCLDGPYDGAPTCGWARAPDASGALHNIPDSQGICCRCPSLGGDPIPRGYRPCGWSAAWLTGGVPGAAYCLRMDDYWWYRGYVIGEYQLDFEVRVQVTATAQAPAASPPSGPGAALPPPPAGGSPPPPPPPPAPPAAPPPPVEVLSLSPSRMTALSSSRDVSARLLGDLASYRQIQVLAGHWLLVPVQPGLDPNQVLTSNLDMWVVVPPSLVTTTGECNKIGVDYAGFRYQPSPCDRPLGACLRNQVYDLGVADAQRAAAGLEPLYNITRYGGGLRNARQVAAAAAGGGLALRLPLAGVRTSLVTLEVRADDVALTVNRAPGKILGSAVCTFDGAACGGFQGIATRGFLRVEVQNTGAVAAEFRAGVMGCSAGVLPVLEQAAAIPAGAAHNFTFDLSMATDAAGNRSCTLVLTDSVGDIADSAQVAFFTTATTYDPPPTQSDLGDKPTQPGDPPTFVSCRRMCPNLFNLKCLLLRGCWSRLGQALATMALIAAVLTVLWLALRNGWIKRFARCAACMLGSRRPRRQKRRREEARAGASSEGEEEAVSEADEDEVVVSSAKKKRLSPDELPDGGGKAARARALERPPEQLIGAGYYYGQWPPGPAAMQPQQRPPVCVPPAYLEMQAQQRPLAGGRPRWAAPPPPPPVMFSNPMAWEDAGGSGVGANSGGAYQAQSPPGVAQQPQQQQEEEEEAQELACTVTARPGPPCREGESRVHL